MQQLFFVYYSDMPLSLIKLAVTDRYISITKEGVKPLGAALFPRAAIRIKPVSPSEDADRARGLLNLLKYLRDGGQIIEYNQQGVSRG